MFQGTHLRQRPFAFASALLLLAACGHDTVVAPRASKALPLFPSSTILTTTPVLWDQSGGTSDHMYSTGEATNGMIADDFVVATGAPWRISEVMLSGIVDDIPIVFEIARSDGPNPSADVVHNYALPPVASVGSLCAPVCSLRDYLFKLPTPLILEPGHYWLVVFTTHKFSWHDRPAIGGTERPVWRSDDAFGGAWVGLSLNDLSFALYGANRTPLEYASELRTAISEFQLLPGIANSLDSKLEAAMSDLETQDISGACRSLHALINEANAQSRKKLTDSQASTITSRAAFIREMLGC